MGYPLWYSWASLGAQTVKNLPAMRETWVPSLRWEDHPGGGHGNPLQYACLENPYGQRVLAGNSLWGLKESETTERLSPARGLRGAVKNQFGGASWEFKKWRSLIDWLLVSVWAVMGWEEISFSLLHCRDTFMSKTEASVASRLEQLTKLGRV